MIQLNVVLIITIISIQTIANSVVTTTDPKHELLAEILGRYRLASRHIHESQSIINYKIQTHIHDISKVDGSTNEFVFRATIQLKYQFEFLHWNASDTHNRYFDIDEITLSKSVLQTLWLPNIQLTDEDYLSFNMEHESAKITRDGQITWIRRGLFTVASPIDLTYYPFDYQYIRIDLDNKEKTFKLQHDKSNNVSKTNSHLSRTLNLWTRLFGNTDSNSSHSFNNKSLMFQENDLLIKPILLRGWFIRTLGMESKVDNENTDHISIYILIQRRREPHIYTTVLPTLFFSVFIFVFYFSSIKSYQRLVIGLLHSFAILIFIVHLDTKISAEQLSYTPLIIRYLSIIFLVEILSLFFDHIIHSIYYGGIHIVSNWLRKTDNEAQPPRLSRVKLLTHGLNFTNGETDEGANVLMKQLIEREETLKFEDFQSYQWHRQACFSECLCCSFFLVIIVIVFIFTFFIIPSLSLSKMT